MSIEHVSSLNGLAGFFDPQPDPSISPSDSNTLLHLIWSLTYTKAGRKILKENRPQLGDPNIAAPTVAEAEANIGAWIRDKFNIQDPRIVGAIIAAHFAADAWIAAKSKEDDPEQQRQEKIYQQNVAVVTWMLWEDAMSHEFSMNW